MEGYFFICDLLGFSNIVDNSSGEGLSKRIQAWVSLVREAASNSQVARTQLISDTLFAAADSGIGELRKLVDFARYLLSHGISQSLPIRGAITFGSYEWGQLIYGKAVIRAHRLEMAGNWIGVTCDNNLPDMDKLLALDSLILYPAPMKAAPIKIYPVVAWDVPKFSVLTKVLTQEGLTKKGDLLGWDWADKVNNTVLLGMYRDWLAAQGKSGNEFHGFLPLQVFSEECTIPNASK